MIILHPFAAPGRLDVPRQVDTWRFFDENTDALGRLGVKVVHAQMDQSDDYDALLKRHWGLSDLLVVEHDMVPTVAMVEAFLSCPRPWCGQLYYVDHCYDSTAEAEGKPMTVCFFRGKVPVHRQFLPNSRMDWEWGGPEDTDADMLSLGLTRFRKELQWDHPPAWRFGAWDSLDVRLAEFLSDEGLRGHIHTPHAQHNHIKLHRPDTVRLEDLSAEAQAPFQGLVPLLPSLILRGHRTVRPRVHDKDDDESASL